MLSNTVYRWPWPVITFMRRAMLYNDPNHPYPRGSIAVIFCAQRSDSDDGEYQQAAQKMENLAKVQDGYLGMHHARSDDGHGITVSHWRDEAAAIGWRDNAQHKAMREHGRAKHYSDYIITVAHVTRGYSWSSKAPTS